MSGAGPLVPPAGLTVAIPTYRRPGAVARALRAVLAEAGACREDGAGPGGPVEVLVIDNDPDGSAREAVATAAGGALGAGSACDAGAGPGAAGGPGAADGPGAAVRYVVEPSPGVSAVRNRALDETAGRALLVFIDDDEEPEAGWLRRLLSTRRDTGAAAVAGLVVPDYEAEPGPWLRAGGFFDRQSWPTGTRRPVAATNNLLLDLGAVRAAGLRFDEAFGATGGEDALFTRSLVAAGGEIVWCDEARVRDRVPAARLERAWVLRRRRSHAATAVRVELALAGPGAHPGIRARALAGGCVRVLAGLGRMALGGRGAVAGRGLVHRARGARLVARGSGMAAAAVGRGAHREYGRP